MTKHDDSPYGGGHAPRRGHPPARKKTAARHHPPAVKKAGAKKRRRRGGRGGGTYRAPDELTSHPITRNAYADTREWLLKQHGPVCAYCGVKYAAKDMTLDHVAPRRGQTAYDRRDNLVLACTNCNMKKRDLAPLAFLLGSKSRAIHLLRYGAHLSEGLIELARNLVPESERLSDSHGRKARFHEKHADDDSPYRS